jgi:hypothetical protein
LTNVYTHGDQLHVLDGRRRSRTFASLVVTFRFLDEINHLPPGDLVQPTARRLSGTLGQRARRDLRWLNTPASSAPSPAAPARASARGPNRH